MANTILTPQQISNEAIVHLENNLVFGNLVNRSFEKDFTGSAGSTITFRKPSRFVVNDGRDITSQIQDHTDQSGTVTVDQEKNVAYKFNSTDLTLSIDEFADRHIQPAMIALANKIDSSVAGLYTDVYNAVGAPGTAPNGLPSLLALQRGMTESTVPLSGRNIVVDPAGQEGLITGFNGTFDPQTEREINIEGKVGRKAGMDIFTNQNINVHTAGVQTGTPLVDGGSQTGASLVTDGWTNSTTGIMKKGDIFTMVGVNKVNPISKQDTGVLQQFVVTADANSGATTGPATLAISPSIVTTGAYQNVTAGPADNAAITPIASHTANMAFIKSAFSLVTVPIKKLAGSTWEASANHGGLSISIMRFVDGLTREEFIRYDVLYGVATNYPEYAYRLMG